MLAFLLACTAPAHYYVAPEQEGAPGVGLVLLCPLNVSVALASELSSSAKPVHRALTSYLQERRGLEVAHVGLADARRAWRGAVAEAKRSGDKDAMPYFSRRLAEWVEFDALLMPTLVLQHVRVTDNSGTWDGVRRTVSVTNLPSRGLGGSADTFSKGVAFGGISGHVMAASLHVLAYSGSGQRVFEGRGGLDFVQEADMSASRSYGYQLHGKALRDPEVLEEGVRIALGPYLPPLADR